MSLRGEPVESTASVAGGREVRVRIGVPDDDYVDRRERDTVDVELFEDGRPLAAVPTLLGPDDTSRARALAREIVAGLESGSLEATAGALERLVARERV